MATREERRSQYAEKNRRRRQSSKTIYAETGRELRREYGGAFGHTEPAVFNKLAEGTAAMRRAEAVLEESHGSTKEEPEV